MHIEHPVTCSFPDAQSIVAVSPAQCAGKSESSCLQGVFLERLFSPLPWFSITAGREGHGCVGEARRLRVPARSIKMFAAPNEISRKEHTRHLRSV